MTTGDQNGSGTLKGRVKRFLGWMTADRRVEAEGEAEVRAGGDPTDQQVDEVEHEVKQGYDESYEGPR